MKKGEGLDALIPLAPADDEDDAPAEMGGDDHKLHLIRKLANALGVALKDEGAARAALDAFEALTDECNRSDDEED